MDNLNKRVHNFYDFRHDDASTSAAPLLQVCTFTEAVAVSCRRQAENAFREREARRDAEWQVEKETGTGGVFALVNRRLGDGGEAAKLLRAADHQHALRLSSNGNGAFERTTQSQAAAPVHNRLSLMAGQVCIGLARDILLFACSAAWHCW